MRGLNSSARCAEEARAIEDGGKAKSEDEAGSDGREAMGNSEA